MNTREQGGLCLACQVLNKKHLYSFMFHTGAPIIYIYGIRLVHLIIEGRVNSTHSWHRSLYKFDTLQF